MDLRELFQKIQGLKSQGWQLPTLPSLRLQEHRGLEATSAPAERTHRLPVKSKRPCPRALILDNFFSVSAQLSPLCTPVSSGGVKRPTSSEDREGEAGFWTGI